MEEIGILDVETTTLGKREGADKRVHRTLESAAPRLWLPRSQADAACRGFTSGIAPRNQRAAMKLLISANFLKSISFSAPW